MAEEEVEAASVEAEVDTENPEPAEDAGEETAEEAGPAEDQDPKPAAGAPGLPVPVEMTPPPAKPPTAEPPAGGGSGGI